MRKVDAFQAFCSGVAVLGLFFGACSSDEALFRDTGDQGDMTDAGEDVRFTDDNRRDAATDSGGKVEVSVDARSVIEAARQTDVGAVTPPKSDLDWQGSKTGLWPTGRLTKRVALRWRTAVETATMGQ